MTKISTDILISGAGIAGLVAAVAFGTRGFRVTLVDPVPPVTDNKSTGTDLRTTAFLAPARSWLDELGIWSRLSPFATPLQTMRIVDASGPEGAVRHVKDFQSDDIEAEAFGWNLSNWVLRRELVARLDQLDTVTFHQGVGVRSVLTRTSEARVKLDNGDQVSTKLVIAADGRGSIVRDAVGIDVSTTKFGQHAVTCAVTHHEPHNNVSTEIHRSGGPFTLVPLPDVDGAPCSALVWMTDTAHAEELLAFDTSKFEQAMFDRSAGLYGPLSLVTKRGMWPIISQIADRLSAERTALVAEAAHVVPPIGAQGLNMSLGDLEVLLRLCCDQPHDIGSQSMLNAYQKARWTTIKTRVEGIKLLNRASIAKTPLAHDVRAFALDKMHEITPVRHGLMKLGLGAVSRD